MSTSEYPAIGLIQVGNAFACTGALIRPNVVLTAAHCFSEFYRSELEKTPPVWFFTELTEESAIRAERVVVQPEDRCAFRQHDVAYVILGKAVEGIEPLAIERGPHEAHCEYAAVGYGQGAELVVPASEAGAPDGGAPPPPSDPVCSASTERTTPGPFRGETPIVPTLPRKKIDFCTEKTLSESGFLKSANPKGSLCIGDSGGPLIDVRTKRIVGVASGSVIEGTRMCHDGSGARYAPVAANLPFIDEALAVPAPAPSPAPAPAPAEDEGCAVVPTHATTHTGSPRTFLFLVGGGLLLGSVARRRRIPTS